MPHWESPAVAAHARLLVESYERVYGQSFPVKADEQALAEALYNSKEYVIVSHGTEEDPVFNYANLAAQGLWKLSWEEFIRLPSRLSAKEDKVEKREATLRQARQYGYVADYKGIRIDSKGKEFYIMNVVLWNVIDAEGKNHGQAAIFDQWQYF